MGNYALIVFFLLFGIMKLVHTSIPDWVLGVVSLAVALALLVGGGGWWAKRSP